MHSPQCPRWLTAASALALLVAAAPFTGTGSASDDLLGCRRAVGREGARLLRKAATLLRKCETRRLSTPTVTCPQPADDSKLTQAHERSRARILRVCNATVPPEFAGDCPAPCAGTIGDAASLADCVLCLAEAAVTDYMGVLFPGLPPPGGLCGDGILGPSEECDPPDDAACPGRCGAPGGPDACQCQAVQSCAEVSQPPGTCTSTDDCPPGYTCAGSQCEAGACVVKADCPADGECVHVGSAPDGVCICRGCGPWSCSLGCTVGGIQSGCICIEIDDCPPADDVCFQGVCS
jgi:hypothetical protein